SVALISKGNDVNGKLEAGSAEPLAKLARRSSARLLTVGNDDDDARVGAEVERLGCRLDTLGQRRLSCRIDRIDGVQDETGGIGHWLHIEVDVALIPRPRSVSHEADATKPGSAGQDPSKSGSRFLDPRSQVRRGDGFADGGESGH